MLLEISFKRLQNEHFKFSIFGKVTNHQIFLLKYLLNCLQTFIGHYQIYFQTSTF
jgi:hypothetical protein